MSRDVEDSQPEVGPRSLFFLRAITLATAMIVLFFIVDAIIG